MVASNARKNFGFLHISFYKVVQIVLPIIYGGVAMMQASVIATIQSVQGTPLATTYGGVPYRCAP